MLVRPPIMFTAICARRDSIDRDSHFCQRPFSFKTVSGKFDGTPSSPQARESCLSRTDDLHFGISHLAERLRPNRTSDEPNRSIVAGLTDPKSSRGVLSGPVCHFLFLHSQTYTPRAFAARLSGLRVGLDEFCRFFLGRGGKAGESGKGRSMYRDWSTGRGCGSFHDGWGVGDETV